MVRDGWSVLKDYFVVGSLVFVCVAIFGKSPRLSRWLSNLRPITKDSPYFLWRGMLSGVILAVLLILCLIGVNSMKGAVGKLSVNIAILVLLTGDLTIVWSTAKRLWQQRS